MQRGKPLNILEPLQYYLPSGKKPSHLINSASPPKPSKCVCVMLTVRSPSQDTGSWEATATVAKLENLKQEIKLKSAVAPV